MKDLSEAVAKASMAMKELVGSGSPRERLTKAGVSLLVPLSLARGSFPEQLRHEYDSLDAYCTFVDPPGEGSYPATMESLTDDQVLDLSVRLLEFYVNLVVEEDRLARGGEL